jgi:hypothetical protein
MVIVLAEQYFEIGKRLADNFIIPKKVSPPSAPNLN